MRRAGLSWVAIATVALAASGCSKNEGTRPPSSAQSGAQSGAVGTGGAGADVRNDGDFVRDVALKNMAEVELSRMALDKAASAQVKAFAQMMIADHGAAGDKLKNTLAGQPIEWPSQLDDHHKKDADELAREQGPEFDREYLKLMIEGHQDFTAKLESRLDMQSVADWKTAAAGRTQSHALPEPQTALRDVPVRPAKSDNGNTMKINQWAADTYPVAQRHLDAARTLENEIKKRSTH